MRNVKVVAAAALGATVLTGCGFLTGAGGGDSSSADAGQCQDQAIRVAMIRTANDPGTIAAEAMAERVAERTDGAIDMQVFPDSQLGDMNDAYAGVASGEIDVYYETISTYSALAGAEEFTALTVPFLWDSYEQFKAVLDSEEFAEIFDRAAEATGVRVVEASGDNEPRALTANRPVVTPADMEGLRIRIADAPIPQAFAVALGAQPQVIALSDLYFSLRQGVVDAQETGSVAVVNNSIYEVQDYYMPTDYIRDVRAWYFNDDLWQGLCEEHRSILEEEMERVGEEVTEATRATIEEAMAVIEENMTVVDVDMDAFREALDGQFDQFDGDMWPEGTLDLVKQLAAEHADG
ncbi:TRAP transporter substrate-binding protein [Georgenia wutianyii]|uniref:TRAP transporter substrate-binding protein n=1 Tax=Georgenia wutianyii TaxID=2585135 RepID=A0ABX5VIY5_9MICO|nr:TRAP transporter substrate-binding protein [Georgenia wutianyii]QDB78342.1 TRAP transporter substrate-binding protein [Georgenia wutianyii]